MLITILLSYGQLVYNRNFIALYLGTLVVLNVKIYDTKTFEVNIMQNI